MSDQWRRVGLQLALGFATGLVVGVAGGAVYYGPLLGRSTWMLAVALGISFAAAEWFRASRRRRS
jgi:hypothetical protein